MIHMAPIEATTTIQCPCCGTPRLKVHADRMEVIGSRYWLSDGDTISGLWHLLTDAQKLPNNFDYEMMVGECHACDERYYVAEACFLAGDRELTEPYLHRNAQTLSDRLFACSSSVQIDGVPTTWLCEVSETPHGPRHLHTFGPFPLDSIEGVIGRYGVTACASSGNDAWQHSADILMALWDEMRRPFMPAVETTA